MAYRTINAGVVVGLGGTPSPPLRNMLLADFWGTPTLRGGGGGTKEYFKIADAPKKSERVVRE